EVGLLELQFYRRSKTTCSGERLRPVGENTRLRAATDAVLLPETEPGTLRQFFVVPAVCGREIAQVERSGVWGREDAFQQLDVGNGLFRVHSISMIHNGGSEVKSPVCRELSSPAVH